MSKKCSTYLQVQLQLKLLLHVTETCIKELAMKRKNTNPIVHDCARESGKAAEGVGLQAK
jgi:hypothetical protein